uniref:Uncharacterized protein n=1 Tax=Romanomermis culicivorax TaxID=13658 RepID=A0A915K117_ROMCU
WEEIAKVDAKRVDADLHRHRKSKIKENEKEVKNGKYSAHINFKPSIQHKFEPIMPKRQIVDVPPTK